jgi:large subunit ribosomal protein L13
VKTRSIRAQDVRRDWFVVDAADRTLGRMATAIANRLRGKHKAEYTPNADTGDFVIVINAERVRVTGKKATDKIYVRHTGHPGGIKNTPFNRMRETHPERIIEKAVKGMLPRNPLGRQMFRKLKVYAGPQHPHAAQQPRPLDV